jgi:hypothetical protein
LLQSLPLASGWLAGALGEVEVEEPIRLAEITTTKRTALAISSTKSKERNCLGLTAFGTFLLRKFVFTTINNNKKTTPELREWYR